MRYAESISVREMACHTVTLAARQMQALLAKNCLSQMDTARAGVGSKGGMGWPEKNAYALSPGIMLQYRGLYRGPLAESGSNRKQSHIVLEAA
jgi:hypothetical protein